MTRYRFTFTVRQFLLGLVLGILALSFVACSGAPRHRPSLRAAATVGISETKGTVPGDSLSGRGMAVGLRGELTQAVPYAGDFEVGLRAGITGRDSHAAPGGVQVDGEAGELSLVGVARGYTPIAGNLSLYAEGFGGYAHQWGSVRGGPIDVDSDGGGLLYGAGAGVELHNGFHLGLEWSRRSADYGEDLQIRSDDLMLVLGGVLRF